MRQSCAVVALAWVTWRLDELAQIAQLLGFAGVALGLGGYTPQVAHLIRQRCSAGISVQAYLIWLSGAVLLLTHALVIYDGVFIVLQTLGAALDLTVLFFATKYRGMTCPRHRLLRG